MVEPSLEFIGRRLQSIQDEQRSLRHRIGGIEARLDGLVDRVDLMSDQLSQMRTEMIDGFSRLEALIAERGK